MLRLEKSRSFQELSMSVTRAELFTKVKEVLLKEVGVDPDTVTEDVTLAEAGLDSLDVVEVVMKLEEHYDIKVEDNESERIRTVGDLLGVLKEKLEKKSTPT